VEVPAQDSGYDQIECIYQKLPGWRTSTEGIVEYEKLPRQAHEYLGFVEKESGAKIGMISTGPDRGHTILMPDFVSELKAAARKA
jgi:adenylosuccinate synthase